MQDVIRRLRQLTKPYLKTRRNDIHTDICFKFAQELLDYEPGDHAVVLPAILCHDLGWIKVPEERQLDAFGPKATDLELRRVHEVEGVKLAREILNKVNYNPEKIPEILEIIDGHDSRLTAISDSDKLVKDADKLFRFDPVGLNIDCTRFKIDPAAYTQWLRAQINGWFFTKTAKQFAVESLDCYSQVQQAKAPARSRI